MIHTNENLAARTDDYISKLVGIIELKKEGYDAEMWKMTTFKDYCNSPADIMPIANINKIDSYWDDDERKWAGGGMGDTSYALSFHENRYRALAECYILMNQGDV